MQRLYFSKQCKRLNWLINLLHGFTYHCADSFLKSDWLKSSITAAVTVDHLHLHFIVSIAMADSQGLILWTFSSAQN